MPENTTINLATDFDLVLPCFNPQPGWAKIVAESIVKLQKLLPEARIHVFLVNDGSTQGVSETDIQFLAQQLPHFNYLVLSKNQGKGFALRAGVAQTQSPFCLYTDIDFPYLESSLVQVFKALQNGADIAVGTRNTAYYQQLSTGRTRLSKWLRKFAQNVLKLPVSDTQCGLKGFNQNGKEVFLQTTINRYLFDLEFLLLANKRPNLKIAPVPVILKPNIVFSNMSPKVLLKEAAGIIRSLAKKAD